MAFRRARMAENGRGSERSAQNGGDSDGDEGARACSVATGAPAWPGSSRLGGDLPGFIIRRVVRSP